MGMSSDKAGFFIMLTSMAGIPGTLIGGVLADRTGRKAVSVMALMMSALSIFPCAFLGKSTIIPCLIITSSFFGSMMHPASSAMIVDLAPPEKRSSAYALLYLGINIGTAITFISRSGNAAGPAVMGIYINKYGLSTAWPVIALLAVFSSLCMLLLFAVEGMSKKRIQKAIENYQI